MLLGGVKRAKLRWAMLFDWAPHAGDGQPCVRIGVEDIASLS